MPITRTPIIDDSGGGTDGTVIDNAWKQELYDQIDALLGPVAPSVGGLRFDRCERRRAGAGVRYGARQQIGRLHHDPGGRSSIRRRRQRPGRRQLGGLPAAVFAPVSGGFFQGVRRAGDPHVVPAWRRGIELLDSARAPRRPMRR